jgi:hypothetical protein
MFKGNKSSVHEASKELFQGIERTRHKSDIPQHISHSSFRSEAIHKQKSDLSVRSTSATKSRIRGFYQCYTSYQIEKLFDLVIEEGKTVKAAALITAVNIRTAQHYIKKCNDDEQRRLPVGCRNPETEGKGKLNETHTEFLVDFIDKYPTSILTDIKNNLCENFQDLSISVSALHRHLFKEQSDIEKAREVTCSKEG